MKQYKDLATTTDNRVYKIYLKNFYESRGDINCAYCPYHGGENYARSRYSRSWKRHRKTQWKQK